MLASITGSPQLWGMIPSFINPYESGTPMWREVDLNYAHGGGWRDFDGFKVSEVEGTYQLEYAGDPPLPERGRITRGTEVLAIFDHAWCLWADTESGETKVARID